MMYQYIREISEMGRKDIDAAGGWHTRTAIGPPVGMWREPVAGTRVRSES